MRLFRSIITVMIIVAATVSFCLLFTVLSRSAYASGESGFMDLESSIKELQQIVKGALPGVVRVIVYDDSGAERGSGSGFFIDSKGRIITNASVLEDAYSAEVFSESRHYDDVVILNRIDALDFALIQVKAVDEKPLELDFEYKVKPGERVVAVGKLSTFKTAVTEGLIDSVSEIGETYEVINIQTSPPLLSYRTSKAGPLLNMSGRVIGVTSVNIPDTEGFDAVPRMYEYKDLKAVSLHSVKQFITKSDNAVRLYRAKSRVWSRWFTRSLKTAVKNGYVILYGMGFMKILKIIILLIIIIAVIQWSYLRLKDKIFNK